MPEKNDEASQLWAQYQQNRKAKIAPRVALGLTIVIGLVLVLIGLWIIVK